MILLHFILGGALLFMGFSMRFGLLEVFVEYCKQLATSHNKNREFENHEIRIFIGELSIKLGFILIIISILGMLDSNSLFLAVIIGWMAFIFVLIGSFTFFDKTNIFKRKRK